MSDSDDGGDYPEDLDGLLKAFKDKLDEATIRAIVEEFHGDVTTAYHVLLQLADARCSSSSSQ